MRSSVAPPIGAEYTGEFMHARLAVSAVSSRSWTLDEDLRFWAGAGIDHVGLSFRKLEAAGAEAAVTRVRDAGMRVSNIVELGWFDLADRSGWPRQQDRLEAAVAAAAALGAACLVLTSGSAGPLEWDQAAAALGEALAPIGTAAAAAGVALALENTGSLRLDLSFVTTLADAVDLARRLGTKACMEVNSCFAERGLAETVRAGRDVLAHVQVSDFVIGSLCTPDRAVPGDGDIPLGRIVGTLIAAGYPGAFELEMVGPRIEAEGYADAIGRGVAHLDRVLTAAGA
jgi:sugar phosphate isomerase/epimerase